MKTIWNIAAGLLCVAMLAQCAAWRQSESQSWNKAKQEWQSGSNSKDVVDLPSDDRPSAAQPAKPAQPAQAKASARQADKNHGMTKPVETRPKTNNAKPTTLAPPAAAQAAQTAQTAHEAEASAALKSGPEEAGQRYEKLITEAMWNELFPLPPAGREAAGGRNRFYSYAAFVQAAMRFPEFLQEGSDEIRRRELAAFLAHVAIETGGLRYLEQLRPAHNYAVDNYEYPPVDDKNYHGRGPLQLSYNYNYGQFSLAYFGDKNTLLERPELLATDSVISFASAIWFWMTMQPPKPSCHDVMAGKWTPMEVDVEANRLPGFGLTLNIINATQCGKEAEAAKRRYEVYERYCKFLGTTKGSSCDCIAQEPYGKAMAKRPKEESQIKDIFED